MLLLLTLFIIILAATAMAQALSVQRPKDIPEFRKWLHLVAILSCATATQYYPDRYLLAAVFYLSSAVLVFVVHYKWLYISTGQSWGIALFPFAFGVLMSLSALPTAFIVNAMLVLAISDALAGLVGSRYARRYWVPLTEKKSVLGSSIFFVSCLTILCFRSPSLTWPLFGVLAMVTLLSTSSELFSWRGSDNFWIPITVALALYAHTQQTFYATDGWAVLAAGILVVPLLYRRGWLNWAGSVAAVSMGVWIAVFIGAKMLVFPVLFLVLGSVASKLNERARNEQGRNAVQVFANGGWGILVAFAGPMLPSGLTELLYVLVFAVANADTMSSEVGKFLRQATFDPFRWKKVAVGLSGGMSWGGTLAGLMGGAIVTTAAFFLLGWSMRQVVLVALLGFLGMLVDSLLGSLLQAKYQLADGQIAEDGTRDQLIQGIDGLDNDWVNFISIAVMLVVVSICYNTL